MTYQALVLRRPSDWHIHVRQAQLLKDVADPSIGHLHWALLMPNLNPGPITTPGAAIQYLQQVDRVLPRRTRPNLWPVLYLTNETTGEHIREMHRRFGREFSVKYYPYNTTTHSSHGLRDIHDGWPVFEVMQELDIVLNVHGEVPTDDLAHAEQLFLELFIEVHIAFPGMRMVLEHVSSREGIEVVKSLPANIAATITAHHPCLTVDDVEEDGEIVYPHHACLPRAKTENDRLAIVDTLHDVKPGDLPKFFFGSDSAPHEKHKKVPGPDCANGVYSGPVGVAVLAEIFEASNLTDWPDRMEQFVSLAGCEFYGVASPEEDDTVILAKVPWKVPDEVGGIVPFKAGETLSWKLEDPQRPYFC